MSVPISRGLILAVRAELKRLLALRDRGYCEIGILHRLVSDFGAHSFPDFVQSLVGSHVVIADVDITVFPIRFPGVFIDEQLREDILLTVFPEAEPEQRKYQSKFKDATQLYSHYVAKRDYFITSDRRILEATECLKTKFGIQCNTLAEYLLLHSAAELAVAPEPAQQVLVMSPVGPRRPGEPDRSAAGASTVGMQNMKASHFGVLL